MEASAALSDHRLSSRQIHRAETHFINSLDMTIPLSVVLTNGSYEYTKFLGLVEDLEDAMHAQDFVVTTIILDVNWVTNSPYTLQSRRDEVVALQDRIRDHLPWVPVPEAYHYFETRVSFTGQKAVLTYTRYWDVILNNYARNQHTYLVGTPDLWRAGDTHPYD
jgi:hypothetical protein